VDAALWDVLKEAAGKERMDAWFTAHPDEFVAVTGRCGAGGLAITMSC
jgi:hypothetical protein